MVIIIYKCLFAECGADQLNKRKRYTACIYLFCDHNKFDCFVNIFVDLSIGILRDLIVYIN